jgi:hypothetical protein
MTQYVYTFAEGDKLFLIRDEADPISPVIMH